MPNANSKLLPALVSSTRLGKGVVFWVRADFSSAAGLGLVLGAGWGVAGGMLCHGHQLMGFLLAGTARAAPGRWRRRRTTPTASWASPTTPALEVSLRPPWLPCPSPSPEGPWPPCSHQKAPGGEVGCCSLGRESPAWCFGCREPQGCWGRMGDMASRGFWLYVFRVETFCLGCILAMRVHVD